MTVATAPTVAPVVTIPAPKKRTNNPYVWDTPTKANDAQAVQVSVLAEGVAVSVSPATPVTTLQPVEATPPPYEDDADFTSHRQLLGGTLRFIRFHALDNTSAARRSWGSQRAVPFQAPPVSPVVNERLMASLDPASLCDVFVAQMPFDMPLTALRALADAVVPGPPIRIAHAAPHCRRGGSYDGCAFVKMPEEDAHRFIAALHKRVLFDALGLWVAVDNAALDELNAYCAWMQQLRPEARRAVLSRPTPFSAVTAELAKRVYVF